MRKLLLILVLLVLPLPSSGSSFLETFRARTLVLPKNEIRAAWVVRHTLNSQVEIDRAIDYAIRARFQLLFVQVRGRADAYYQSELEPAASSLELPPESFDPLSYVLARAHEADIAVHAWINVCYVWSDTESNPPPDHIVRRHPEWLMADENGVRMDRRSVREWKRRGLEGYYVSPGNPAVREHTAAVVKDIVSHYKVDGIHLDYVRYPSAAFDFSASQRTEFKLRYGIDPLALVKGGGDADLLDEDGVALLDSLRSEWQVAQLDSLVRMVRRAAGKLPLSAAVIPDFTHARADKGQDWPAWVQRGDVDFVVPMAYSYEPAELVARVRTIKRTIGAERFLVGLPVFDNRARYLGYSVSLLRRDGILGYSLFSYNALEKDPFSLQFLQRVFLDPAQE